MRKYSEQEEKLSILLLSLPCKTKNNLKNQRIYENQCQNIPLFSMKNNIFLSTNTFHDDCMIKRRQKIKDKIKFQVRKSIENRNKQISTQNFKQIFESTPEIMQQNQSSIFFPQKHEQTRAKQMQQSIDIAKRTILVQLNPQSLNKNYPIARYKGITKSIEDSVKRNIKLEIVSQIEISKQLLEKPASENQNKMNKNSFLSHGYPPKSMSITLSSRIYLIKLFLDFNMIFQVLSL